MLFNSLTFPVFLAFVLTFYWVLPGRRSRTLWLLASSYVFYGWWDWRFLGLILLSSLIDYLSYWHFVSHPDGPRHTEDAKRRAGLERIDRGDYAGGYVHPFRLVDLSEGVRRLRAKGVEVLLVLPPIEPGVLDHWLATPGGRDYLPQLRVALRALCQIHGAGFADYTDPRPLGYDIESFIDWFHGGELVYAAMLLDMANRPDLEARLGPYIAPQRLEDALNQPLTPYTLYPG